MNMIIKEVKTIKKITVIIPIYNVSKYLDECINSLVNQTYKNIEIILINDGSTDKSLEICKKWEKIDKRIKIINQENSGVANARNKCLENAKGEYIVFVDGDDFVEKNYLKYLIEKQKNADMNICSYREYYKNSKILHISYWDNVCFNKENAIRNLFKREFYGGYLWNKIFKKEILDLYNIKFDENIDMCEDMLFVIKYMSKINNVNVITDDLYNYRMRKSSIVWNRDVEKYKTIWNAYRKIEEILKENNIESIEFKYSVLTTFFVQNNYNNEIDIKNMYKDVIKSNAIPKKKKIKICILKNCKFLYKIYLNFKKNKYELFE